MHIERVVLHQDRPWLAHRHRHGFLGNIQKAKRSQQLRKFIEILTIQPQEYFSFDIDSRDDDIKSSMRMFDKIDKKIMNDAEFMAKL
jgi:hypothetical protein